MKLMGFNFRKISAEKKKDSFENLNLKTNLDIKNITSVKQGIFKMKEELVGVEFSFNIVYEPEIAELAFEGNILLSLDSKLARDVLKQWKDKKIPDEFRIALFNIILRKSSVKALMLEDELALPYHFPMPRVSEKKEE